MVSPTLQSTTCLIEAVKNPTSPAFNESTGVFFGVNIQFETRF